MLSRLPPGIISQGACRLSIISAVTSDIRPLVWIEKMNHVSIRERSSSPPGCDISELHTGAQLQKSQAAVQAELVRSIAKSSVSGWEPRLHSQRLLPDYFTDLSQCGVNIKSNINVSDFGYKSAKEFPWIDSRFSPGWIRNWLEVKDVEERASQDISEAKPSGDNAQQEQVCLDFEHPALVDEVLSSRHVGKARFSSGLQVHTFKAHRPPEGSGWQTLSIEEALGRLDKMDTWPSVDDFICVLQKCMKEKNLVYAKRVHAHICSTGLETHRSVGNHIVPVFVECGSLSDAEKVFNRLVHRNEHSWTSLIFGYIQCGQFDHAFSLYQKMQADSVLPSSFTLVPLLKSCAILNDVEKGRGFHADISRKGLNGDLIVENTLISMYAKCGSLSEAQNVFDNVPARDVVSWTALIGGYAEHGPGQKALNCFEQMQLEGFAPNAVTFVCVLKACASIGAIDKGREMHVEIKQTGYERHPLVGNTLFHMYVKCGSLSESQEVFDKLPVRDDVLWTALIAGYVEHGPVQRSLECFEQMQLEGISPDVVTFVCALKACVSVGAMDKGRQIHMETIQKGFEGDLVVGSTLVSMYAKCGSLLEANEIFANLSVREVVSWNALIGGYTEHGPYLEALTFLEQMQLEGFSPDAVTFICVLKACGNLGAMDKGRGIHTDITHKGFESDPFVGSTLVDIYAKCSSIVEAEEVFAKLQIRDVVSWNALIAGYVMNHKEGMALQCFEDMQEQVVNPDPVTFTSLLTACSHANLLSKGQEYFRLMQEKYGIAPTIDHYTCMVYLLARSGQLHESLKFLESVPCPLVEGTWRALLSGCKTYGEAELGQRCFEKIVQMNPENASSYVLMADIYGNSGRWDDAYRIEELRKHAGAKKKPASAWIEVNMKVHEFVIGNNYSNSIPEMLEVFSLRMKDEGHVPNLDAVLKPISDELKGASLCEHVEKVAIAFGLLNTPQGQTLRVTKNLRMCNDCHNASKVISRFERREIIVRDICCIHHFKDGLCSCGDMF